MDHGSEEQVGNSFKRIVDPAVFVDISFVTELVKMFEDTEREGKEVDEPEGNRYIRISDTLAKYIAKELRKCIDA